MTDELRAYRERVEAAAASGEPYTIFNGSTDHAQIVIAALLRNAKQSARALAGGLNNRVWGHEDTIAAVRPFLERGGKLTIVIDEDLDLDEAGKNYFVQAFKDRLDLRKLDKHAIPSLGFHFLEADEEDLRIEPDTKNRSATVIFNDPVQARVFSEFFKLLEQRSVAVSV